MGLIYSVEGTLSQTGPGFAVVDVGGVGIRAEVTPSTAARIGGQVGSSQKLHTSFVVREDSLTLYGFDNPDDRDTFEILMTVSGIGPRLGIAALDVLGADGLRSAVAMEDLKALCTIPGVGKKTASRMVLEIGDKLGAPTGAAGEAATGGPAASAAIRDAVEAGLEQLGWPRAVAQRAVDNLEGEFTDVESMLRAALSSLGNQRG